MTQHNTDIDQLAHLCRIQCSEEEKKQLSKNLTKILDYINLMNEIDTDGVPPCTTVLETMTNAMREDEPEVPLKREDFLAMAPDHIGGMLKVPPVIQFEEES
ncbi:MAG: Glutamyl-tRNA(Gln) amidotransferase subunit C [Chlamydiae bacterium]|nr:Glutamyl-tRNA(Gln) amidotransferase subunit C [Chlamydiota bacterium]